MKFSINRVWLLLCKQWAENRQLYILGLLATAGIMSIFFLIGIRDSWGFQYHMQQMMFYMGAIASGAVFSSTLLSQFSEKPKGIVALTLPASALEKLTVAIIYTFIFFPLMYLLVVYPVLAIVHYIDVEGAGHINSLYDLRLGEDTIMFIKMYVALQSFVLLCSVIFRRFVFVKTAVLFFVLFFAGNMINQRMFDRVFKTVPIGRAITANVHYQAYDEAGRSLGERVTRKKIAPNLVRATNPYSPAYVVDYSYYEKFYHLSLKLTGVRSMFFSVLFLLSVPFLWLITWYRLKETEL